MDCPLTKGPPMGLPGWLPVLTTRKHRDNDWWRGYAAAVAELASLRLRERIEAGPTSTTVDTPRAPRRGYVARLTTTGHILRLLPSRD